MTSKLTAPRALTALLARRFVNLATIIAVGVACAGIILAWLLAHFFSAWWWLLAIPFAGLLLLFLIVRFIVMIIVRLIHPNNLTNKQRQAMNEFIDKIQVAIEARATPVPLIVLICLKDIILHRDVVTVKKIIKNTAGLKNEYEQIEKLF